MVLFVKKLLKINPFFLSTVQALLSYTHIRVVATTNTWPGSRGGWPSTTLRANNNLSLTENQKKILMPKGSMRVTTFCKLHSWFMIVYIPLFHFLFQLFITLQTGSRSGLGISISANCWFEYLKLYQSMLPKVKKTNNDRMHKNPAYGRPLICQWLRTVAQNWVRLLG